MSWRTISLVVCVIFCFTLAVTGFAQDDSPAFITQFKTDRFPLMTFYLDPYTVDGRFIHGLEPGEINILENDITLPVKSVEEIRTGVQLVVAISPGSSFLVRNSQGYSRYDSILENLVNWARTRLGTTIDDLSIVVTEGPENTHLSNALELFYTLADYDIETSTSVPSLDTLFKAIEIASDPSSNPASKKVVLFITAPIEGDLVFPSQNLLSQSQQHGVHIFVWLVSVPGTAESPSTQTLVDLTRDTRGNFFFYSGSEVLPDLESYLEPFRNVYSLQYESAIRTGGAHQILFEANHRGQSIRSDLVNLDINILPPNPAFLSPTLQIKRLPDPSDTNSIFEVSNKLIPEKQDIQIIIDFPDTRSRMIQETILYVDGKVVDKNTTFPFDHFTWDISNYLQDGQHILQVEVVDQLGLRGKTIETPVNIIVEIPDQSVLSFLARNLSMLAIFVVVLSGAVLLLVLILGGKVRPASLVGNMKRKRKRSTAPIDPLTAPVKIEQTQLRQDRSTQAKGHIEKEMMVVETEAVYLTRTTEGEGKGVEIPITFQNDELHFGSDPNLGSGYIKDPSVEILHARLVRNKSGTYTLVDEGSIAGTWINYSPVSREGRFVRSGDLIHIGRVGFRFTRTPIIRDSESEILNPRE
jgi:hypothetical protein